PILGTTLYILIGQSHSTKKMRERYEEVDRILFPMLPENRDVQGELEKQDRRAANIAGYLNKTAHYPTYRNTDVEYYDDAAVGLEAQIRELRKAEKFIFMEYHAIENAGSWAKVERVLVERARAGVDVRVFYDDMGSIGFINNDFVKLMESKGIRCRVFNPFTPGLNIFLNHRDHRKITVIDGKVGFTGGYNMANEYFHVTEPYGFWKDTGVRLTGDAVKSLTVTFLEMWNAIKGDDENDTDFEQYLPDVPYQAQEEGFVIPYADSPIDGEQVGENVYISIAEYAKDYVWFVTPYLILTDEMIHALGLASKRGVDVRVITPGIPDKKMVYSITRSYYHSLVRNGVRIYEFTPGFCHCKMSIADDWVATCGTINLDYRSLYHHFENGCLFCGCNITGDIRKDFESMMAQSREVTQEYMAPEAGRKLLDLILRLVAPLL
ncbi:MAG: cardiolipin synthase, partial [Lachnospiraceae bacterium]|nr:cardiolipin synthase [Lachnospiraceae bacterium]